MFNFKIDKVLTAYLAHKKLRLEELFVIVCFNLNKIDLLKDYLSGRNGDQLTAYFQPLERKLLLKRLTNIDTFDWDNYELTDYADTIYDDCNVNLFDGDIESLVDGFKQTTAPKGVTEDEFAKLVLDFQAKFPTGIRNKGGESISSHPTDIAKKMKTFITKYKYNATTILAATDAYLGRMKRDGYAWCNAAHYFILKNGISKLAAECESLGQKTVDNWDSNM
jgi:hypothetical protein